MAFRHSALNGTGMFDPIFGAGAKFAGEEWELAIRLSLLGWKGIYTPAPTVWHHHGRKAEQAHALLRGYKIGEGAIYGKALSTPGQWRSMLPIFIKSIARHLRHLELPMAAWIAKGAVQFLVQKFSFQAK